MIHYYSYYSVGGYKDMYLGNNSMGGRESTYYLPLLPSMETEAEEKNDATLRAKVMELKKLPSIEIGTRENNIGLPDMTFSITTKGGYSLIYTHLENKKHAIILHDVINQTRDDAGCLIPFLVMFMCDAEEDVASMDKLALYIASNIRTARKEIGKFFCYDPQANGLRFDLSLMNQWVDSIVNAKGSPLCHVNGKEIKIHAKSEYIAFLLVRRGITTKDALTTLSMDKSQGVVVNEAVILPHDNELEARSNVKAWKEHRRRQLKYIVYGIISIVTALIIFCLTKCGGKTE